MKNNEHIITDEILTGGTTIPYDDSWKRKVRNFVHGYLVTMRPYLMFISGITGIAGISFGEYFNLVRLAGICMSSFLSYGFGQALTDCSQTDTDAISSPYRPLARGAISKKSVLITSIIGLCICCSVFILANPVNALYGVAGLIGLSTYTYFKRRWWAGPFYNAGIVWLLYMMAINAALPGSSRHESAKIFAGLCIFFGYANFVLTGYFKDIAADRATSYLTLPVRYGRRVSAIVSDIFALLTISGGICANISSRDAHALISTGVPSLIALVAGISVIVMSQYRLHNNRVDEEAYRAIIPGLHGYVLVVTSIILANQPSWFVSVLVFVCFYMITLQKRPEKTQI